MKTKANWEQKKLLLDELTMKEGFKVSYSARQADRKGCKWCERFAKTGFRFCVNCGSPVKDESV